MNERYMYRGKRIDNGEWVTGYYVNSEVGSLIFPFGAENIFDRFEVDPDTVGQCTGLKDKNGVLIFEGDKAKLSTRVDNAEGIIRFGHYRHRDAPLDYICGDYGFYVQFADDYKLFRNDLMFWIGNNYIEIIGNIHDNPDLKGG